MTNILIVDDDKNVLHLVDTYLTEQGYQVFKAKDGSDALEVLKKENCQLAVVDVMMPLIDGFELTKIIRDTYNIPVILLTAKKQIDDKEQGFEAGADDYLVKPFQLKELGFRIKALLRLYSKQTEDPVIKIGKTRINKLNYEVQIND